MSKNQVTEEGANLIKSFESCRLKAYDDGVGVMTIGYGHTEGVRRGQTITQAQADKFFEDDLEDFAEGVAELITTDINDNQFSALVSLSFNIGLTAFKRSTLLRRLNAGNFAATADQFLAWNKGGGKVMRGLTRRREAERKLFLKPVDDAPLPVDAPKVEAAIVTPPSAEQPSQTVEANAAATQVNVSPNALAPAEPIVSQPEEPATQASTGNKKSLWTTLTAGAAAIPTGIIGLLQGQAEVIKWALIMGGAVAVVYLIRQIVLDWKRMETKSDPKKYSVK